MSDIKTAANAPSLIRAKYTMYGHSYDGFYTESHMDYVRKHNRAEVIEETPVGVIWPEGVEVEMTRSTYRNCYSQAWYVIRSPRLLTDEEISNLRSSGAFMGGQVTGRVGEAEKQLDGTYHYGAYSCCDSGD